MLTKSVTVYFHSSLDLLGVGKIDPILYIQSKFWYPRRAPPHPYMNFDHILVFFLRGLLLYLLTIFHISFLIIILLGYNGALKSLVPYSNHLNLLELFHSRSFYKLKIYLKINNKKLGISNTIFVVFTILTFLKKKKSSL